VRRGHADWLMELTRAYHQWDAAGFPIRRIGQ
jgi:hypothetical protein